MTWDYPPTTAGKIRYRYPPTGRVERSGGPERIQVDPEAEPVQRRYVGFMKPENHTEPTDTTSIPGVW